MARFVHMTTEKNKPRCNIWSCPWICPTTTTAGNRSTRNAHNDHAKTWKTWDLPQLHTKLMAARKPQATARAHDPDGLETRQMIRLFAEPLPWTAFASGANLITSTTIACSRRDGGDERGLRRPSCCSGN